LHCCACLLILIFDVPFGGLPTQLQFQPMQASDAIAAAAAFPVSSAVLSVALLLRMKHLPIHFQHVVVLVLVSTSKQLAQTESCLQACSQASLMLPSVVVCTVCVPSFGRLLLATAVGVVTAFSAVTQGSANTAARATV